ncbi:hypothetical protein [Aldersonia kunmingensis]|uniref:hypothetical protein n=1 Tax=Aldersonia kunmingensis TaxID=408066 RepID=UPI00083419C1|nr:hypothetical protein [Aldersonia kunmingensis]
MKFTRTLAIASVVVASAVVGAGTTYASPAPAQDIRYHLNLVDKSVVMTLDNGTFTMAADRQMFEIADSVGNPVVKLPLSFGLDSVSHPLNAAIEGNGTVLKLTPDMDPAKARSLVRPVASQLENERALSMFNTALGAGAGVGSLVGTAVGLVVGTLIGATTCLTVIACIPGLVAGAALGGILGTIIVGGPVLVVAAIDLISTLAAPPGTTKYNYPAPAPAPLPAPAPAPAP